MVIRRIRAWRELLKIGRASSSFKQIDIYFRANVLDIMQKEGLFEYLKKPRSLENIMEHFSYTDKKYLLTLMHALVNDNTIERINGKYLSPRPVFAVKVKPSFFNDSIMDLLAAYAEFIPERLQGKYFEFSSGFNLFNWDDTLSLKMYNQVRKAAFAFVNPLKHPGKFLDVGSGNGWGTAAIWCYHYRKSLFYPQTKVEIFGIEPDEGLLQIAQDEFPKMVQRQIDISFEEIREFKEYHPKFIWGSVNEIPFDDDYFDYVYVSQVFHWTNPKTATEELYRVLKPGGIAFGTENFTPRANLYTDLHIRVMENAYGFFSKEDAGAWAKSAGFRSIKFTTPITVFEFIK